MCIEVRGSMQESLAAGQQEGQCLLSRDFDKQRIKMSSKEAEK